MVSLLNKVQRAAMAEDRQSRPEMAERLERIEEQLTQLQGPPR